MGEVLATRGEEIRKGATTVDDLARQMADLRRQVENIKPGADDRVSIIVFSGDLDKVLAAFVIATGAVAMGMEAVKFFTFWGTPVPFENLNLGFVSSWSGRFVRNSNLLSKGR